MKVTCLILAVFLAAFCECGVVKRDVSNSRPKIDCKFMEGVGPHPFLFIKWGGDPYALSWDKDNVAFIKEMTHDGSCPYAAHHHHGAHSMHDVADFAKSYTSEDILNFFGEDCVKPF